MMTMFRDQYLPTDNTLTPTLITNPQEITNIMEADALKEDKPTNPGPEQHPQAQAYTPAHTINDHVPGWDSPVPASVQERTANAMLDAFMTLITPLIERTVERKFAALVQNHNTLTHMDENLAEKMKEIAEEVAQAALDTHEDHNDHHTEDSLSDLINSVLEDRGVSKRELRDTISDMVDEKIGEAIEQHESDSDHLTEFDVEEVISRDLETTIKQALGDMTFTVTAQDKE